MNKELKIALGIINNDRELFIKIQLRIASAFTKECKAYKKAGKTKYLNADDLQLCAHEAARAFLNEFIKEGEK
jgi:hypothetical protein